MKTARAGLYFETRPGHYKIHDPDVNHVPRTITTGSGAKSAIASHTLPHIEAVANVTVANSTSRTIFTQTFSNHSSTLIERMRYCFPLYHYSVVTSFRYWHGRNTIEGVVKPRKKGRQIYEQAIENDIIASLFEQHTSEVFEISLGNLQPQCSVVIEIQYVTELKPDLGGEGMVLTIPFSIAPREKSDPRSLLDVDLGMAIKVDVSMPVPIRSLQSLNHRITTNMGMSNVKKSVSFFRELAEPQRDRIHDITKARVTLSKDATFEKDFVLAITTESKDHGHDASLLAPRALIESCHQHPTLSAIQVAFTPRDFVKLEEVIQAPRTEIVLLLDLSNSMGTKLKPLQQALSIFLHNLDDGTLFNTCVFGADFQSMWERSKPLNKLNVAAAEKYASELKAGRGGTNIRKALEKLASRTRRNYSTQVVVFTDGEVCDTEAVHDFIRSTKDFCGDSLQFFALGIGDRVSHSLIEGIGKYGGGFAEVVGTDMSETWNNRIIRMLQGVKTASDWQIDLVLTDRSGAQHEKSGFLLPTKAESTCSGKIIQAPHHIPILHGFTRTTIYMLVDAPIDHYDSVEIRGETAAGQRFSHRVPLQGVSAAEPTFSHLAVRALLSDIETGYSWLHIKGADCETEGSNHASTEEIDQEAESIAMLFGLASHWTNFVAVNSADDTSQQSSTYRVRNDRRELQELLKSRKSKEPFNPGPNMLVWRHDDEDDNSDPEPGPSSAAGGTSGGAFSSTSGSGTGGANAAGKRSTQNQGSTAGASSSQGASQRSGATQEQASTTMSVQELANLQDANGGFNFESKDPSVVLRAQSQLDRCFATEIQDSLRSQITTVMFTPRARTKICTTLLCIEYMRRALPICAERDRIVTLGELFLQRFVKDIELRQQLESEVGQSWRGAPIPSGHHDKHSSGSIPTDVPESNEQRSEGDRETAQDQSKEEESLAQDSLVSESRQTAPPDGLEYTMSQSPRGECSCNVPSDTLFWRTAPGTDLPATLDLGEPDDFDLRLRDLPQTGTSRVVQASSYPSIPSRHSYYSSLTPPAPRTQPASPYSAYAQAAGSASYSQASYSYPAQAQTDQYSRPAAAASGPYATPTAIRIPGYYLASDGRWYPISQQSSSGHSGAADGSETNRKP